MSTACPPLPLEDLEHVLAHTLDLWEEARGQRFFITGGTGFFGMWLVESFCYINDALGLGMHATILTRNPAAFAAKAPHLATRPDLTTLQGDIRTFNFPEGNFPFVIHAATEASAKLNEEAPDEMLDAIIGGTRHVLDFAARVSVQKLLLTSSGAIYGRQPPEMTHISEDYAGAPDPLLPGSAYGEGKRVSEHMCVVHAKRFGYEAKIARCFAFVGPHLPLDTHFAIGNFLRDAMAGNPICIAGDGTPRRSYLYAADLSIWLWTILFRGGQARAYNVGSEEDFSISELAELVRRSLNVSVSIETACPLVLGTSVSRYVPGVSRAQAEFRLGSLVPLINALQRTARWYRSS